MLKNAVTIAYFGAAAFKITTVTGKKILIDPYISENPACSAKPDFFYDTDLLLVSHGASDHLGDTIEIMNNSHAVLICGADVYRYSVEMGIPKERLKSTVYGDEKDLDGISIKTVYARHLSKIESGNQIYYGWPMGFVVTTENNIRIYHAGDTSLFGDMELIGRLYKPNILMVGISRVAEGFVSEMDPAEAALATLWVAPDVVLPMHYPPESDEPAKFLEAVKIIAPRVQPILIEPNSQITYNKYKVDINN